MATLKPRLILKCSDATDDILNMNVSDSLQVTDPFISPSKVACTTTGEDTVIVPASTDIKYVYIKHTGKDASDAPNVANLLVEITNGTQIAELAPNEWMILPFKGPGSVGVQVEAASTTIVVEYAYWTKA
jgi:hypothetical protein|tara:strand:+ start:12 stop:401 length:390 start_codon:yes stop_codon:yes gene_type:complete